MATVPAQPLDFPVERQPVHAGHLVIQERHIIGVPAHELQGAHPIMRDVDAIAQVRQDIGQVMAGVHLVINHKDMRLWRLDRP